LVGWALPGRIDERWIILSKGQELVTYGYLALQVRLQPRWLTIVALATKLDMQLYGHLSPASDS
jgi:hypothetical protein